MRDHQPLLSGCVMLGVGAGFNYIAGTLKEMPDWMVAHSLGWLFRLFQEPGRLWRRYVLGGLLYLWYNAKYGLNPKTRDRLLGGAGAREVPTDG